MTGHLARALWTLKSGTVLSNTGNIDDPSQPNEEKNHKVKVDGAGPRAQHGHLNTDAKGQPINFIKGELAAAS